jgi:hypothetical protein
VSYFLGFTCLSLRELADDMIVGLAWREMKLFVAKVLWSFDVEMLPNQNIVYERDFTMHGMWEKSEFWVHSHPIVREK